MSTQLSPGVLTREIDLSTVVTGVATTGGALAGPATWGPANVKTLVDSELTYKARFGEPDNNTADVFFTAASFLGYGNSLTFVRAISAKARNAAVKGDGITSVAITNAGAGYVHVPTLAVVGGTGSGATATATVASGKIQSVTITSAGTGYLPTDTVTITVTLSGGDTITTLAVLTPVVGIIVQNDSDYEANYAAGQGNVGEFIAKYAGIAGDGISIGMCDNPTDFLTWTYAKNFTGAPGTSDYAAQYGGSDDELHLVVIDNTGFWSGTPGTVLEKLAFVSKASDAFDAQGNSIYYVNQINRILNYIRWADHPSVGTNWGSPAKGVTFARLSGPYLQIMEGGNDSNDLLTDGQIITAYDQFLAEDFDFSLLMTASHSSTVVIHCINDISEFRQDNVTFVSPPKAAVVNNVGNEQVDIVTYRNTLPDSSYGFMDANWIKKYDKYNDVYRWVPANGDVAGLCVRTDQTRDPWFSPAGLNRGQILNVTAIAWNPRTAFRDVLYQAGVNPIVQFPGQGTILYGDKTMQSKPSAFDRINVRRLFIVLRKSIAKAAQYVLFEFNDDVTRTQFRAIVDPFLRDVQGRRGVYAYQIVCDATNNTPQTIDTNGFRGDIYIQPAKSINFILLNFVATRTGIDFSEIIGQF